MTNKELRARAKVLAKEEQRLTAEIIELIAEVIRREAWKEFGFTSLFRWLREELEYSEPAAQRRIDAARLLIAVPEVKEKLETGELNLTNACKLQNAIQAEEKEREVTPEEKKAALDAVEGKAGIAVDKVLVEHFPASGETAQREVHRVTTEGDVRCSMNLSGEAFEMLKRVKEVLSHSMPNATDGEVIAHALEFLLEKKDPLRRPASSDAEVKSKAETFREVHQRHEGKCCYVNPETGETCGSAYQVEIDHIIPKAKAGTDDPKNLRLLCKQHNLLEAERHFGKEKMKRYRKLPIKKAGSHTAAGP